MTSGNIQLLKVNWHWQKKGWHFEEIMQMRKQLWEMDPFSNVGTKEIQQEIGGDLDTDPDPVQFQDLKFVLIDDKDFNGDLEFIILCPNLENLFICGIFAAKKIKNLTPLATLTGLKYLHLEHHEISEISALKSLSKLEEVYLSENPLLDITGVNELPRCKHTRYPKKTRTALIA